MISINLKPEYIFSVYGFGVSNTLLTSLVVTVFLTIFAILVFYSNKLGKNIFLDSFKVLVYELLLLTDEVTMDRNLSKKVLPLIVTFFVFISAANLLALIPGFLGAFFVTTGGRNLALLRSPNSDLNTTLALAIVSVVSIQIFSIQILGLGGFIKRFFNFSSFVGFLMGFFEIISEAVKVLSFSFRLFGNVFAGEILLLISAFLIPFIIPVPFMILEVFVGVIQAFIFAILTLTFIKTATLEKI